ncbi:hypothetical protein ILUMI_07007 [Ignelater luminosus]|uniref:Endonuclease/exonuclease/phosphatase domain-containing protein n=1 Tax=Ignelater luminosus TaxID=2038154 RepID=A0A8K0DA28_IGNLU|nr:hypothetical protein ILUMI_07007 [Ignelater luminosus]
MTITIKIYGYDVTIIAVYAPVDSADNQAKNEFYKGHTDVVRDIKRYRDIIIAGDLNARIKSREGSQMAGRYAEEVKNDSGERYTPGTKCKQFDFMHEINPKAAKTEISAIIDDNSEIEDNSDEQEDEDTGDNQDDDYNFDDKNKDSSNNQDGSYNDSVVR